MSLISGHSKMVTLSDGEVGFFIVSTCRLQSAVGQMSENVMKLPFLLLNPY